MWGTLIASSFGLAALFPSQAAFASRAVPPVGQQPGMAEIVVKPDDFGTISKYLFGTNLLWADDAEGAFDPVTGNFYPGFVSLLRDLGVTAIRYPAGTTSDSFDWQRAIGTGRPGSPTSLMVCKRHVFPRSVACSMAPRPRPSAPDELGKLLDETGAIGTVTVNFATGTAQEAADFVAYMAAPLGGPSSSPADPGYWATLRARNGHPAPYEVPYWEVGNEQSFPGQYGWRSGQLVSWGRAPGAVRPGKSRPVFTPSVGQPRFLAKRWGHLPRAC